MIFNALPGNDYGWSFIELNGHSVAYVRETGKAIARTIEQLNAATAIIEGSSCDLNECAWVAIADSVASELESSYEDIESVYAISEVNWALLGGMIIRSQENIEDCLETALDDLLIVERDRFLWESKYKVINALAKAIAQWGKEFGVAQWGVELAINFLEKCGDRGLWLLYMASVGHGIGPEDEFGDWFDKYGIECPHSFQESPSAYELVMEMTTKINSGVLDD